MKINAASEKNWMVLEIIGSVDAATAPALQADAMGRIGAGAVKIALDVSQVDYISSAGLRVLLMVFKACNAGGGHMRLLCPSPFVTEVLEVSGFTGIIPVAENRDDLA